ncbi:MAG TPA: hypothetical protein VMB85_16685 [Bryobacteraceae bacterium]|nr:hypothetical protein [Bryobacteraceae bacterium]
MLRLQKVEDEQGVDRERFGARRTLSLEGPVPREERRASSRQPIPINQALAAPFGCCSLRVDVERLEMTLKRLEDLEALTVAARILDGISLDELPRRVGAPRVLTRRALAAGLEKLQKSADDFIEEIPDEYGSGVRRLRGRFEMLPSQADFSASCGDAPDFGRDIEDVFLSRILEARRNMQLAELKTKLESARAEEQRLRDRLFDEYRTYDAIPKRLAELQQKLKEIEPDDQAARQALVVEMLTIREGGADASWHRIQELRKKLARQEWIVQQEGEKLFEVEIRTFRREFAPLRVEMVAAIDACRECARKMIAKFAAYNCGAQFNYETFPFQDGDFGTIMQPVRGAYLAVMAALLSLNAQIASDAQSGPPWDALANAQLDPAEIEEKDARARLERAETLLQNASRMPASPFNDERDRVIASAKGQIQRLKQRLGGAA